MRRGRSARPLGWLGALLVLYLAVPVLLFFVRIIGSHNPGFGTPGLWTALKVSVEGATISLALVALTGIPLAYLLARRKGWLASAVGVAVQLPLALPPLMGGILLIYLVGPYTFLGQHSGERLTQSLYGVVIAQSFVSAPFLVIAARSAFAAVDPALGDVAATLGHRPVARFLRVDIPAAADGIRAGMVLMWLRAFGEYGSTVVLAYHPFTLPIFADNQFSGYPLSTTEAPTILAFGAAAVVIGIGQVRRPARTRRRVRPAPEPPLSNRPTPVSFDLDLRVGSFSLAVAHAAPSHRLAIVGPSGSGKSVTLRSLAGLLGPGTGPVLFGDVDVTARPPEQRRVGYVPQGFGLLPGRTVWEQVTFGVTADPGRAAWWLETLHLDGLDERLPDQLSGGQRQRVSLARALAGDPEVVLLDEPFSALDAPVRAELRRELRRLQRQTGLSTVLVTHDPEEAAMLADEIIVVADGRVLQAGPCAAVFRRPASPQVARLLGIDNMVRGVAGADGDLVTDAGPVPVATGQPPGTPVLWCVRPEQVVVGEPAPGGVATIVIGSAVVVDVVDLGRLTEVTVHFDGGLELRSRTTDPVTLQADDVCGVEVLAGGITVWGEPSAAVTELT